MLVPSFRYCGLKLFEECFKTTLSIDIEGSHRSTAKIGVASAYWVLKTQSVARRSRFEGVV